MSGEKKMTDEPRPKPSKGEGMFRKEALDKLSSREELDHLFLPTPSRRWIEWLAGLLLLAAAAIWAVWGKG